MSNPTDSIRQQLIESLKDPDYRRAFAADGIQADIAIQVRINRERRGWKQTQLAKKMGKPQGTISKLENPEKEGVTLKTLNELAAAFDTALLVRFVPFSELINWLDTESEDKFFAVEFDKDPGIFPPPESKPQTAATELAAAWSSQVAGLSWGAVYTTIASGQIEGSTQAALGRARLGTAEIVVLETPKNGKSKALIQTPID